MSFENSVGIVAPQRFFHDAPMALKGGGRLPSFELVFETYGTLNAARSNAVLVCHALAGSHHVAGVYADAQDSKAGGTIWSGRGNRSTRRNSSSSA